MTTTGKQIGWKDRLLPTTTVRHARLQIFQPTRHPVSCTREIIRPGTRDVIGTVKGKLGVMHALFLEAVCFHAERTKIIEGGSLQILVDPYRIRKTMSAGSRYSAEGAIALVEDIKKSVIRFNPGADDGDLPDIDGILDRIEASPRTRVNPVTGEARHLKRIVLSPTYRKWLEHDLGVHYDPSPLAGLRYGITAAVARLALTHRDQPNGGWRLDGLIQAVGAAPTRRNRQMIRKESEGLAAVGLTIDGSRVLKAERTVPATPAGVTCTPAPYPPRPRAYPLRQRE